MSTSSLTKLRKLKTADGQEIHPFTTNVPVYSAGGLRWSEPQTLGKRELSVKLAGNGALRAGLNGLYIKVAPGGGLGVSSDGIFIIGTYEGGSGGTVSVDEEEIRSITTEVITSGGYVNNTQVSSIASGAVSTLSGALQSAINSRTTVDSARTIAEGVLSSGGTVTSFTILSGMIISAGAYVMSMTSGGGMVVSANGAVVSVTSGAIIASGASGESVALSGGTMQLHFEDSDSEPQDITLDTNGVAISAAGADRRVVLTHGGSQLEVSDYGVLVNSLPVLTEGSEIDTTVGDYHLTYTSDDGFVVSGGGMQLQVSSGAVIASGESGEIMSLSAGTATIQADNGESISAYLTLESGGIKLHAETIMGSGDVDISSDGVSISGNDATININSGAVLINSRQVLTALDTATDTEATSATFGVLEGGTSYIYTQPLMSLDIDSVSSVGSGRVRFTLIPGGSVTIPPEVTVYDGGSSWAYGQYLLELENGEIVVHSGGGDLPLDGVAGVFVKSGGVTVAGEMTTSGATVGSGVTQYVYPLGSISATTVDSGGSLSMYGLYGQVTDTVVADGAVFDVAEPEYDFDPVDFSIVAGSATQIEEGTLQYGGEPFTGYASDGGFYNLSGTYRLGIGSGVSALSPIIGNSDTSKARIYVFSGAYVSGAQIGISGDINVYPGGMVEDTTLGGYEGSRYQCELTVWGGTASGAVVSRGAFLNVISGGQMLGNVSVLSGGSMRVRVEPAYAENIHIERGAAFSAWQNASIGELHLSSGASAHASGGTVINEVIVSAGTMWLKNASATTMTLGPFPSATGRPVLSASGASIDTLTISTYGAVTLYKDTTVTNLDQRGGYVIARGARISGGYIGGSDFQVSSGTTATNLIAVVGEDVTPKKKILISNGGVVSRLTVEDTGDGTTSGITNITAQYGVVSVLAGGRLFDTEFTNIVVSNGGIVDGIIPKRVYLASGGGLAFAGSLHIYSGGTALNVVSGAHWDVVVESGGSISYVQED